MHRPATIPRIRMHRIVAAGQAKANLSNGCVWLGSRQTAGSRSDDSARNRACGACARPAPTAATHKNPFLSYQRPDLDRGLPLRCISTAADRAVHARSSKLDTDTQEAPKSCLRRPKTWTRSGIERATLQLFWKTLKSMKGWQQLNKLNLLVK